MKSPKTQTPHARQMHQLIEKYLASALTQNEFCLQENLFKSTFTHWLRHYRKYQNFVQSDQASHQSFIPIKIKTAKRSIQSHSTCVIELPNGINIKLEGTIDYNFLVNLIHGGK
jgi:hypothetical protein